MYIVAIFIFLIIITAIAYPIKNPRKKFNTNRNLLHFNQKSSLYSNLSNIPKPYILNHSILTNREIDLYVILTTILTNQPYTIVVKPRIADFITVTFSQKYDSKNFYSYFNKISAKHVDFLVCDMLFRPLLAIELDDSTHNRPDRKDRDNFINHLYKSVGLQILHIYQYTPSSIENQLSEMLLLFSHKNASPAASPIIN